MSFYTWELIKSGAFTNNFNIEGLDGDSDEVWLLIIAAKHTSPFDLLLRFNDDDGPNYDILWHAIYKYQGTAYHDASSDEGLTEIYAEYQALKERLAYIVIGAKSGRKRHALIQAQGYTDPDNSDNGDFPGFWRNTNDNITKINIITGAITEGKYFLYKVKSLVEFAGKVPLTWGLLPKSQVDDEKIEEAINRLIQAHDDDETAHLGAGQSLQSHKVSEIIDHLVASIIADKLAKFSVNLEKLMADRIYFFSGEIDNAIWEYEVDGNGSIVKHVLGIFLMSGNVSGNYTYIAAVPGGWQDLVNFGKDIIFQTSFQVNQITSQTIWLTVGCQPASEKYFGFKIVNNKLYSVSWNTGSEESTELLTLTADTIYVIRADFKVSEQKIYFYVDEVLKATHTTNIPSGTTDTAIFYQIKSDADAYKRLVVHDVVASFGR